MRTNSGSLYHDRQAGPLRWADSGWSEKCGRNIGMANFLDIFGMRREDSQQDLTVLWDLSMSHISCWKKGDDLKYWFLRNKSLFWTDRNFKTLMTGLFAIQGIFWWDRFQPRSNGPKLSLYSVARPSQGPYGPLPIALCYRRWLYRL